MIVLLSLLAVYALPDLWALHIGGRFTPFKTWDGWGVVRASSGGRYVLFTHLRGGVLLEAEGLSCDPLGGCESLHGSAKLCTEDGSVYSLSLRGAVDAWWSTDGARTSVELEGRPLPKDGEAYFSGRWHGPALSLVSRGNSSFTEAFTRTGAVWPYESPVHSGTATVTIRHGSLAEFKRTCRRSS